MSHRRPTWIKLAQMIGLALVCVAALVGGAVAGWMHRSPLVSAAVVSEVESKLVI